MLLFSIGVFWGGEGVAWGVYGTIAYFRIFSWKIKNVIPDLKTAGGAISASYAAEFIPLPSAEGISIEHIVFSWTRNIWLFLQDLQLYLTIIMWPYLAVAERYFCREQARYFNSNESVEQLCKSSAKNSVPGLNTQPADMHMASNHTGSLAGFKSHGDMMFYAHCCSIPAPHSTPTQRQDRWDTYRNIFWGAGQKFPLTPHLLNSSHFACSDPTSSQVLLMLISSEQAEAAAQLWWATCMHRCFPLCPKQEQTHTELLVWKVALVMFRCREAGGPACAVSWHTKARNRDFWPWWKEAKVVSQCQQRSGDQDHYPRAASSKILLPWNLAHGRKEKLRDRGTWALRWWRLCQQWHFSHKTDVCFSSSYKGRKDLMWRPQVHSIQACNKFSDHNCFCFGLKSISGFH